MRDKIKRWLDRVKRRIPYTHLVFILIVMSAVYIVLAFPELDTRISGYPILFIGVPMIFYLFSGVKGALRTLAVLLYFYLSEPLNVMVALPIALMSIVPNILKKLFVKKEEKNFSEEREEISEEVEEHSPFEEMAPFISSRMLGIGVCILSMASVSLVVLGAIHQILFILLLLWPIISTIFYYLRQEDVMFSGVKHGKPSTFVYYLYNPIFTGAFSWMIIIYIIEYNCLNRHPYIWGLGFLGMLIFFIFTMLSIKEVRNRIGVKIGMAIVAIGFGLQIAAVLFFMAH